MDTSGDDTFVATIGGDDATYTAGDVLDGGAGTNTLNIDIIGAASGHGTGTVLRMQDINVTNRTMSAQTFDATGIVGPGSTLTYKSASVGNANATITNAASGLKVVAGEGVTGTLAAGYVAGSTAIVDGGNASSVTVTGGSKNTTVTASKASAISISGTSGDDVATISARGDVALTTNNGAQVETLTLSGNGGEVNYTLTGTPTKVTYDGLQNVTLTAAVASVGGKALSNAATFTGKSTLALSDNASTVDLSKAAVDNVQFNVAATASDVYTVRDGQNVIFKAGSSSAFALAINDNTSANVEGSVRVVLDSAVAFTGAITLTNTAGADRIKTATFDNSKAAQSGLNFQGLTYTDVILTGSKDVTVAAASTAKSLNASDFTGNLTVTAAANTIKNVIGGKGNDTFITASGADVVLDGGSGSDTLQVAGDMTKVAFTNFELVTVNADVSGAKLSQFDGQTFGLNGSAASKAFSFGTAAANYDLSVVDLSKMQVDDITISGITFNASNGLDTSKFLASQGVTYKGALGVMNDFTGTKNADIFVGGNSGDTVRGGAGADDITLGKGADTVILGSNIAVPTAADVANHTGANADTVKSFTTGTAATKDVVQFDIINKVTAGGDTSGTFEVKVNGSAVNLAGAADNTVDAAQFANVDATTLAANTAIAANQFVGITEIEKVKTDGTAADLIAKMANGATGGVSVQAAADTLFIVNYTTDGKAQIWYHVDTDSSARIAEADLKLVGVFDNVTADSFVIGNFNWA